jgi:F-type H+-transporting ATPase subunit alpha
MKLISSGKVLEVKDGIVFADGLSDVGVNETVDIHTRTGEVVKGLALNLEEERVGIVVLGDYSKIIEGDSVYVTEQLPSIKINKSYLGRVIDALGNPIDGLGDLDLKDAQDFILDKIAPGVLARKDVKTPVQTGILSIDAMIPIGRGQRELVIGDRQTGKTSIGIDTLINIKEQGIVGIYVAIGQKTSKVAQIVSMLREYDVLDNTIIVSASASDPASMQYLAAYTGTAVGEYFAENGMHALVIYDDLTKHAQAYRQISLLLRRPSGREAYPGDIFYLHSKILERSVQYNDEKGGGSLTALPIIETQAGDVAAYIPTNVISITDGQIVVDTDLFNSGYRPAVNVGLSVSRVGGDAQTKGIKSVAGKLKGELAQYRELAVFAQFGSDLDKDTAERLGRGERATEIFKQKQSSPRSIPQMIGLLYSTKGLLDKLEVKDVSNWAEEFSREIDSSDLKNKLDGSSKIEGELEEELKKFIQNSIERFLKINK